MLFEHSFVRPDDVEAARGTGERARERWQKEEEEEEEEGGHRRTRRGRRGPKGLTRALKIENSKWPIFPADGTETKSRPAFIMTCIAVYARLWFALFRCRTQRGYATANATTRKGKGRRGGRRGCIHLYARIRGYICVTYSKSYRTTLEASRSTDTAGHRYIEKISAQAVIRKTDALCCDSREREREEERKREGRGYHM